MLLFFRKQLMQINFGVKTLHGVKHTGYISENVLEAFFPYLSAPYETDETSFRHH